MGSTGETSLWRRISVISGLSAAAVAAPLLDIYGRNPEVFVANQSSGPEIVLFGILIALTIPVVALALLSIADWVGGRAPGIVYLVLVYALAMGTGFVVSRQVFPDNTWLAIVAIAVVTGLVVLVRRWFEGMLAFFAVALPMVLVLFLSTSASARLVWEEAETPTAATPVANEAPIVFIQLDEFPLASIMDLDGSINETLFPNFARLARQGTWYRNALSNSIATTQSVPAILTGKLGEKGLSPSYVDHPDNLFTLLAGTYEMHVIEWVADLCPEEVCPDYAGRAPARFSSLLRDVGVVYAHLTLPVSLRESLPSIDNAWKGFLGQGGVPSGSAVDIEGLPVPPGAKRVEWADWVQRLINGIDGDAEPILHYAHLKSPHVPWETNPSGTHYLRPEEYTEVEGVGGDGHWSLDPEPALVGFQRHIYQVGFLDRLLGRLLDHIDDKGAWDDTMIVVLADHGASFVPGEHRRWPYEDNRDDLYRIPLFIKYPNQKRGDIVDTPAYGIDVLPTIVDALDIDTDWKFDGMSLLETNDPKRPHRPIWWCCNGDPVSTDLDILYDQVARDHMWVPDQGSWLGVAGAGPYAGLIGVPAASLDVTESEQLHWSLDLGQSLSDVDFDTGFVQTFLTGRIELPEDVTSDDLAVVVNGRVGGFGYVARDTATGGTIRALVSEGLVDEGHNDLDILVPRVEGGWMAGSPEVLSLELETEDGRQLDVRTEGSRRVQVDKVEQTDVGWRLTGWAVDVNQKVVADTIYVYAGEQLVVSGVPDQENRNVVRWFESEDLAISGFVLELPATELPANIEQVTVVAEFGSEAVADPVRLQPAG